MHVCKYILELVKLHCIIRVSASLCNEKCGVFFSFLSKIQVKEYARIGKIIIRPKSLSHHWILSLLMWTLDLSVKAKKKLSLVHCH